MIKYIYLIIILIIGIALGNRVFNHIDAWVGRADNRIHYYLFLLQINYNIEQ